MAFAVLCLMAHLAASIAELRAVGTRAASGHVARTPAVVAARSLLATTDATVHPADPYVAELQRCGCQVVWECDHSHLCSCICLPQRFHGVSFRHRNAQ
uniref:Secreted protein n=1 Tax=Trichogramma kaykai TaxID=54128 RepID=A0ABD2W975_9HYME